MTRLRRSMDDEAARVASGIGDDPPAPASTACTAYGCPLSAGLLRDGQRFCAVHFDVTGFERFPAATAEILARPHLVEAIALLRQPGSRLDREVIAEARAICPTLTPTTSPYALLVQAEGALRAACLSGCDAIYRPPADTSVAAQLAQFARAKRVDA